MHNVRHIALAATLAALAAPTWAAPTYTGVGSYNLGSATPPGLTAAGSSSCGAALGQDAIAFDGDANGNNIVVHAYACDGTPNYFGSRASGENTFYANGVGSVLTQLTLDAADGFSFYLDAGEVGAFGSTAFAAGEFQKAMLAIKLQITNTTSGQTTTWLDELWSVEVAAGGAVTNSYTSNGTYAISSSGTGGAADGFYSYGFAGGNYFIPLDAGTYDISYVMTSTASGQVSQTSVCTAYLQSNKNLEGGGEVAALVAEVPDEPRGEAFTSYCGAGARTGDPFPAIARVQDVPAGLPEPMSAGLALTALLAAAGVRRRRQG
ncbi:hypothetical protein NYO99_09540 [Pelomonas sp. UHG3]|uniref:Uncharacterized protein n=1 Tax=Roseateles hydrophilus TaxID=2975054 RepID=A0ACC6C9W7_9BURK|nr:hypothetical protein [Pelomonas sp. UHG3]MCY4745213.1 hypothetical protein [Pelomonas sp. UHG3]